jgi:flavin reductase (DIM6/NTAB) family NADH-FMN oxidoreductase RutF
MEYRSVPYTTLLPETLAVLNGQGLLLVSAAADGTPNAMTIGWGAVGCIWGLPVFTVLVRPSRHTYTLMEQTGAFTVCVPPASWTAVTRFCGTQSGRTVNKFSEQKLVALPSAQIAAPGIEGSALIYECRVVHSHDMNPASLDPAIASRAYAKGDFHRVYQGQILSTHALPNAAELLPRP